jgi:chromosome segregation ATPase
MNEQTDTPETDENSSKWLADENLPICDAYIEAVNFARSLERERKALRKEVSQRKAQVEDFQSLYAKAKQESALAEEENNALRAAISACESQFQSKVQEVADEICKNDALRAKVEAQSERIRYLEGAINHAEGTPLSVARKENKELRAAISKVAENLGNGSFALPDCSHEWMVKEVPDEVRLYCGRLRSDVAEWKRRHDNAEEMLHHSEEERSALRAEVEKLKADKARLEYILIGTGITREIIDNRMNGGVR